MSDPILVDNQTVRLTNGRDFTVRNLLEFRVSGDLFITRRRSAGRDVEEGRYSDEGTIAFIVQTDPGIHIGLDETRTNMALPSGVIHLPASLRILIQDGTRFVVLVSSTADDVRNIYSYDDRGNLIWRIGELPATQRAKEYAAIDIPSVGPISAMNAFNFTAYADRETGAIVGIKNSPW